MTIHILVEGPSESALLERWTPRLLKKHPTKIHPHQGKGKLPNDLTAPPATKGRGLLDQLPAKLRGFANSLNPDADRVVVLVDADNEDVSDLVDAISNAAQQVSPSLQIIVRLAVEETEAFYLGDLRALERAFPNADMKRAQKYKPDMICGTWGLFGKIVGDAGGNKVAWAEAMGPVLTTKAEESRSPSFRRFLTGLVEAVPRRSEPKVRRSYRHPARKSNEPGRRR